MSPRSTPCPPPPPSLPRTLGAAVASRQAAGSALGVVPLLGLGSHGRRACWRPSGLCAVGDPSLASCPSVHPESQIGTPPAQPRSQSLPPGRRGSHHL